MILEPLELLETELQRRKKRNPRYSMRAFAGDLGLDVGYLSKVLSGKKPLSVGAAQKAAARMQLTDAETAQLLESVADSVKRRSLGVRMSQGTATAAVDDVRELDADAYALISDMHHYLILEATTLADFEPDARWVARRLRMTVIEAEQALARLLRLGLLRSENGTLKKTDRRVTTRDKSITTPALKESQRQILRAGQHALAHEPIEARSTTGMTMTIDPAKLPIAKKLIQTFMEQLCEYLEAGERREVYQLSVNLFSAERSF